MHAPPIMWRAWGRGMPRVIGRRWLPSATGSQKENADPASPAIVVRQPRHRELFSLPWQRRRRRAGHWAVHDPMVPATLSSGFGPEGPRTRRFISQAWRVLDGFILELLTLDRIAFASLNSRARLPSCGGDARIIRQVRRCRITFPEIFLRALNLLGRFRDCVPDGVGRRRKSRRCHPGRSAAESRDPFAGIGTRRPMGPGSPALTRFRPG